MSTETETDLHPPRPFWRRLVRWAGLATLAVLIAMLGLATVVLVQGWEAIGYAPRGERLAKMRASPQWADGVFENPQPLWNDEIGMVTEFAESEPNRVPDAPLPVDSVEPERFMKGPASGLRITWLGHSTLLIEIDGQVLLTDPVWGPRTSPVDWLGPKRWYAPPLALEDLPKLDAVLISHDHYDHLDYPTIVALAGRDTRFFAPLGVGAHLEAWGVPAARIEDVDWWDVHEVAGLTITTTPSRHASGRQILDQNRTLWAGYAIRSENHNVFFSGDTGLFPGMTEIGERLGPFEVTMLEVGAYAQAWPDWHLGPEQAVTAHQMLQGEKLLPVHWGLFDLANHGWAEPMERVMDAAAKDGVSVLAPRPGQSLEPTTAGAPQRWWPELPYRTAEDYPIEATKMGAG
ncbi:MAG: MBL fold metallo-hydrolase [Nannocystales bacterium]